MGNKQFAVIGIGRFGASLIKELVSLGHEVLAVDNNPDKINKAVDFATHAVEADAMDEGVLKALGIRNFDVVIVSIGANLQANILTTVMLKEIGVKKIVAKAQDDLHGRVLERIGADLVVYPERDMAVKIANSLSSDSILDYIELSPMYSLVELHAPTRFINKTLAESDFRNKFGINILAVRRNSEVIVSPPADEKVLEGDDLVILGHDDEIQRFSRLE
ncbi:MAG: TrkA family potassium uptake protein [Syntrophomonadaceae bacterium]|jgi:trk system potassium uptake protein TrkA|nr:TrkA family potassium uptake protein [Syntrophomonadaceae bacterium]